MEDWPPSGQLQLEGLVYDHFDDDSPLDVNDRLTWLRRQYAPSKAHEKHGTVVAKIEHNRVEQRVAGQKGIVGVERQRAPSSSTVLNQSNNDRYALATTPTTTPTANSGGVIPTNFEAPATQMTPPAPTMIAPQRGEPSQPLPITASVETIGEQSSKSASPIPTDGMAAPSSISTQDGATAGTTTAKTAATDSNKAATETTAAPDPSGRRYITQPYTQLASVYRAIGQDEQANTVLVARAQRIGELAPPFSAQGLWYGYLGRLIGYGYEPFRAIRIGLVIIAIGAIIFSVGARRHLMAETKLAEQVLSGEGQTGQVSSTYPRFNAIIYSLDVFLPFVDLNQVCYWIPGEKPSKPRISRNCLMHLGPYSLKWSAVLHCYLWFQTLAGWTLCTLLAAAVTGVVQS